MAGVSSRASGSNARSSPDRDAVQLVRELRRVRLLRPRDGRVPRQPRADVYLLDRVAAAGRGRRTGRTRPPPRAALDLGEPPWTTPGRCVTPWPARDSPVDAGDDADHPVRDRRSRTPP